DPAGVGDDGRGAAYQRDELEVPQRLAQVDPPAVAEPGGGQDGAAARMYRHDDVDVRRDLLQRADEPGRGGGGVDVRRPVQSRDDVPVGQSVPGAYRLRVEAVEVPEQRVDHGVAHQVDPVDRYALRGQVADGLGAGREQQVGELVGDAPVDLLGHARVEAAQAGLDVRDRQPELRRDEGGGDGGVDIAVHHDEPG